MSEYPSALLVFAAGLLSFFSPCVLPLIPSYLSILGSAGGIAVSSAENEAADKKRFVLFIITLFFILGFTTVFIVLSIIVSSAFFLMGSAAKYIQLTAGAIVIILGINYIFDFLAFLNYEKRLRIEKPRGLVGAFLAGAAFSAGWTPCVGPILTGVLFLAGQSGKTGISALYLALYSLGLGLPFLLSAIFLDRFLVTTKKLRARLPLIKKISGVLLVVMGVLILTGRFSALNIILQKWQYKNTQVEAQVIPEAERALRDANIQVFEKPAQPRDFTLPLLGGGDAALSSYKGKIVILNFWATWCPPCRAEMPSMETLYRRFKDQGLEILAVDIGEDIPTVREFIQSGGYSYPVLLDSSGKVSADYGIRAIPTTFIIDREGKIIGRVVGSIMWDNAKVISAFEALLKS